MNLQEIWNLKNKNTILGHKVAELEGSEKQISWARSIREEYIKELNHSINRLRDSWEKAADTQKGRAAIAAMMEAYLDLFNPSSKFWIEEINGKSFNSRVSKIIPKFMENKNETN